MNKNIEQATINQLKELGTYHKFKTIYADPPWSKWQNTKKRGALRHYDLMTQEQIEDMPIKYLAAENAHLYLWIPAGLLPEGLRVMEAWGFSYRNFLSWPKLNALPLGNTFRNNVEAVLFGVRGKAPVKFHGQPNLIIGPRQDHSHKPEETYPIIERMSHEPYLELFARRRPTSSSQDNWYVFGNEIDTDVYIPGYPVPRYSNRAVLPDGVPRIAPIETEEEV